MKLFLVHWRITLQPHLNVALVEEMTRVVPIWSALLRGCFGMQEERVCVHSGCLQRMEEPIHLQHFHGFNYLALRSLCPVIISQSQERWVWRFTLYILPFSNKMEHMLPVPFPGSRPSKWEHDDACHFNYLKGYMHLWFIRYVSAYFCSILAGVPRCC